MRDYFQKIGVGHVRIQIQRNVTIYVTEKIWATHTHKYCFTYMQSLLPPRLSPRFKAQKENVVKNDLP